MSRQDKLSRLIRLKNRRLQKLKEQQALYGLSTEPHILIEIEDLEAELEMLQSEFAALEIDGADRRVVSNKPAPVSTPTLHLVKIKNLEKRLAALLEDYEAASEQMTYELDQVNRRRLQRRIKILEDEIDEVERAVNRMKRRVTAREIAPIEALRQATKWVVGPVAKTLTGRAWKSLRQRLLTQASKLPHYSYLDTALMAEAATDLSRLTREGRILLEAHRYAPNPDQLAEVRQRAKILAGYLIRIYRLETGEAPELEALENGTL